MADDRFKKFVHQVREMRRAQIAYFRLRTNGNLEEAKAREREVDKLLREFRGEKQPGLFEENP